MNTDTQVLDQLSKLKKDQFRIQLMLEELAGLMKNKPQSQDSGSDIRKDYIEALWKNHSEFSEIRHQVALLELTISEWKKRSIDFLTAIENAVSNDDLDPIFREALEKTFKDFCRIMIPMGFDVIRPKPGELFDDRIHQAISESRPGILTISRCVAWGYRSGDQILQPAQVILGDVPDTPEIDQIPPESETAVDVVPHKENPDSSTRNHWMMISSLMSGGTLVLITILGILLLTRNPQEILGTHPNNDIPPVIITEKPEQSPSLDTINLLDKKLEQLIVDIEKLQPISAQEPVKESKINHVSGFRYTVREGDSLWSISKRFYFDGHRYHDIMVTNRLDSEELVPGMILTIPDDTTESNHETRK